MFKWSRVLHIYMSTALFSLLIFFSVTGVTLNHLEWVSTKNQPQLWQADVPKKVLNDFKPPISQAMIDWLKTTHNLPIAKNIGWDDEFMELTLDYSLPAGYAYVVVDINQGKYSVDYQTGTVFQLLNDLHKGRHSGPVWSWLIDLSAVFMVFFSITGLIILWQNRPKRRVGIILTVLGTFTPVLIYAFFVPAITGVV